MWETADHLALFIPRRRGSFYFYVQYNPPPWWRPSVDFARIAANGTILTKTQVTPAVRAEQLSAAINSRTGEYILLWWDIDGTFAAEVSASGRVVSLGRIADSSSFAGDYASLAFNPASGTFLTAGVSGGSRLLLRELNQYGAPLSAPTLSRQLVDGVISVPPAVSDWRVPTPGGCTTPDPFVALGGGTCVNGGWYPPGMGAPVPTPPPPPVPGGCITPDPFVALGGGRCINGGWYPPGMGSSATQR